jgi:hypothetical protein
MGNLKKMNMVAAKGFRQILPTFFQQKKNQKNGV